MNKVEEQSQTLSMTEMNRFVSSNMRSLAEKNQVVIVTRHNKPFAAILPVKAYRDLVSKEKTQQESAEPSFQPPLKPKSEREALELYPELTLRLPMDGSRDWANRQLELLLTALLEINKVNKVETEGVESGGCL